MLEYFDSNSGVVEGILVMGQTDYKLDPVRKCLYSVKYDENDTKGEKLTRITIVRELEQLLSP